MHAPGGEPPSTGEDEQTSNERGHAPEGREGKKERSLYNLSEKSCMNPSSLVQNRLYLPLFNLIIPRHCRSSVCLFFIFLFFSPHFLKNYLRKPENTDPAAMHTISTQNHEGTASFLHPREFSARLFCLEVITPWNMENLSCGFLSMPALG